MSQPPEGPREEGARAEERRCNSSDNATGEEGATHRGEGAGPHRGGENCRKRQTPLEYFDVGHATKTLILITQGKATSGHHDNRAKHQPAIQSRKGAQPACFNQSAQVKSRRPNKKSTVCLFCPKRPIGREATHTHKGIGSSVVHATIRKRISLNMSDSKKIQEGDLHFQKAWCEKETIRQSK